MKPPCLDSENRCTRDTDGDGDCPSCARFNRLSLYTATKPLGQLIAWCQTHGAEIEFRGKDTLVKARVDGTVRRVARPTFGMAVERLMEMEDA